MQTGTGNTASTADNRKQGQRQGTATSGDGSPATNASQREASAAWWVWLLVAAVGAVGWEWLSHQGLLAWLPWRARVG